VSAEYGEEGDSAVMRLRWRLPGTTNCGPAPAANPFTNRAVARTAPALESPDFVSGQVLPLGIRRR
jgi:hypothetical protein